MKYIALFCLFAVAIAAPHPDRDAQTISDRREGPHGANFNYAFETSNGINAEKTGVAGSQGQSNFDGGFRFPLDDGTFVEMTYVADEFGYQPQGSHLPVAPPAPPHVAELLRIAEEQRAAGITFDRK